MRHGANVQQDHQIADPQVFDRIGEHVTDRCWTAGNHKALVHKVFELPVGDGVKFIEIALEDALADIVFPGCDSPGGPVGRSIRGGICKDLL